MAEQPPTAFFIGDDLALDFLEQRRRAMGAKRSNGLPNGSDLVAWLEQAHAVPASVVAQFRKDTDFLRASIPRNPKHASYASGSARSSAIMLASRSIQRCTRTSWRQSTSCLGVMKF